MTLLEFLNELKHKSLNITLINEEGHHIYTTELGQYFHWVYRIHYDDYKILLIEPANHGFTIQLDCED